MRIDEYGRAHTLEQDIMTIWRQHGLDVIEEKVRTDNEVDVWVISATRRSHE